MNIALFVYKYSIFTYVFHIYWHWHRCHVIRYYEVGWRNRTKKNDRIKSNIKLNARQTHCTRKNCDFIFIFKFPINEFVYYYYFYFCMSHKKLNINYDWEKILSYLLVITINSSNGEKKALITANFIGNELG